MEIVIGGGRDQLITQPFDRSAHVLLLDYLVRIDHSGHNLLQLLRQFDGLFALLQE